MKEDIEQTITKNNPVAHDHYDDHGDDHEARTTDRISDGATKEITPHLVASFSPEVYHPLYTILYTLYTILILSHATNIWHMTQLSHHHILHFMPLHQFQHTSNSLVQHFSSLIQHRRRILESSSPNPSSCKRILRAASMPLLLSRSNAQGSDRVLH